MLNQLSSPCPWGSLAHNFATRTRYTVLPRRSAGAGLALLSAAGKGADSIFSQAILQQKGSDHPFTHCQDLPYCDTQVTGGPSLSSIVSGKSQGHLSRVPQVAVHIRDFCMAFGDNMGLGYQQRPSCYRTTNLDMYPPHLYR